MSWNGYNRRTAAVEDWTDIAPGSHFVQFYDSHDFLARAVAEYFAHGIKHGETCILVATPDHARAIENRIAGFGDEFRDALEGERFMRLDAADTLAAISENGGVDRGLFEAVIGEAVRGAAARTGRVRIFGEMVDLLWRNSDFGDASRLEEFWTDLQSRVPFSLFCAYFTEGSAAKGSSEAVRDFCDAHSRVILPESYTELIPGNERTTTIAFLQQRVRELEAEVVALQAAQAARTSAILA